MSKNRYFNADGTPEPHPIEVLSVYVGQQVIHRHTGATGTLLEVEKGCNGLLCVQWGKGCRLLSWASPFDVALASCYPVKRWPHITKDIENRGY